MTRKHTGRDAPRVSEAAREAAHAWLLQLHGGEVGEDERAGFAAWLRASDENAAAFAQARRLWALLPYAGDALEQERDAAVPAQIVPIRAGTLAAHRGRPRNRRLARPRIAITGMAVAIVAALLGIGFLQNLPPATEIHESGIGEVRTVALADGSELTLDAATRIDVRLSRNRREIDLVRGGAYFVVTHAAQRPCVVTVGRTRITVLGTRFDARHGARDVRVSVAEGVVEVADASAAADAQPRAVRLSGGEQVVATRQGRLGEVHGFDAATAFAWREGRLVYQDAPLADIVADLNRRRRTPIVLSEPALGELRLSTSFRTEQSDRMLAGLAALHGLELEETGTQLLVRRKRQ